MYSSLLIPLCGGLIIGLSASLLMVFNGRIAGISGIISGALWGAKTEVKGIAWQWYFLAGLVLSGLLLANPLQAWFAIPAVDLSGLESSGVGLMVAGGLIGLGASLSNGCTSGHGVCGIGRLSVRSMVATLVFMLAGVVSTLLLR